ncbi:hypothetical protein Syun_029271 [Stephania yunnanensis]|uniref:Oberon PHD finger domain-containing protein n=1 Tax=Stephania yunnanensis TaxID=152371 RepID=A0AAP0HJB0_9MAGN
MPKRRLSSSSATNPETETPEKDGGSEEELRENGILLSPVAGGSAGEGLPYAPVDWPEVGDVWGWKVGKRKTNTGFLMDRYLCLPPRLQAAYKTKAYFASKLSVKQFVEREFPDANVDAFFSLFSWKVPSKDHNWGKDPIPISCAYPTAEPYYLESDDGSVLCKARNKMCSLHQEEPSSALPPIECQICCLEPGFCRNCCCILCSKTIDWANGGYSFVRCEAKLGESHICGHAAHVDCALRSYMAGTVGGNIGLDAEYYCRRCDQKTDLVSHVTKAMKICESLDSQGDIKKILEMGFCILRGSHAKWLLSRIELALRKLKAGVSFKDTWDMERDFSSVSAGGKSRSESNGSGTSVATFDGNPPTVGKLHVKKKNSRNSENVTLEHQKESLKLDDEIAQVLQDLKKSQELEYRMAEQKLYAQKDLLVNLYEQLDRVRAELARCTSQTMERNANVLLSSISNRIMQIKQELGKLKDIEEVAKGFGKTPRSILKEHFGLQPDD